MDNKYKFVVTLPSKEQDPNGFYKAGIVDKILNTYKNLTVAGIDAPEVKHGIQFAGPGNLLTFGTSKTHDVEWIRRPDYAREKGYAPVLDLIKDWAQVVSKLDALSREKKRLEDLKKRATYVYTVPTYYNNLIIGGVKVQVFDNFIKAGNVIIPREVTKAKYEKMSSIEDYYFNTLIALILK